MESLVPAAINGAVVVLLWGLLWRNHNQRIDTIQGAIDKRVDRDTCQVKHESIHEDLNEIKNNQQKMSESLEQIRMYMARELGRRSAKEQTR